MAVFVHSRSFVGSWGSFAVDGGQWGVTMAETAWIGEDYRTMQAELHRTSNYGAASVEYVIMKRFRLAPSDQVQKCFEVLRRKRD